MLKNPSFISLGVQAVFIFGLIVLGRVPARAEDFGVLYEEKEVLSRTSRQAAPEEQCTFDPTGDTVSTCDLITDVKRFGVADWTTGQGDTFAWSGGPPTDASNSPDGGYAFIEMDQIAVNNKTWKEAWLLTRQTPSTGPDGRCLSFNFATGGLGFNSLEVHLIQFEDEVDFSNESAPAYDSQKLWFEKDSTGRTWDNTSVTYTSNGYHSLAFVAKDDPLYSKYSSYAAVDNIEITSGPCASDCHFNNDFCSLRNVEDIPGSIFELSRGGNKRGTGPGSPHLSSTNRRFGIGGCAIFDSSFPRRPGDTARLVSQTFAASDGPTCLSFWASMYGNGVGSLSVIVTTPETNATKVVWRKDGSFNTDRWVQCQTTIANLEDYTVTFEATIGEPNSGDIGLDTISFTPGECPHLPPGVYDNNTGDCPFTSSACAWTLENDENLADPLLKVVVGQVGSNLPGHTEYSHSVYNIPDQYAKFDLGLFRNRPRESAALSYKVTTPGSYCLSFWISMYTDIPTETQLGSLRVIVRGETNETVWRLTNQQYKKWEKAQVPLQLSEGDSVAIEGTKGRNFAGGMLGVDDITLYEGVCEILPLAASVTRQDCSFDKNKCNWSIRNPQQDERPSSNWIFTNGTSYSFFRDKTYGADKGGYMSLETFNTAMRSQLISPSIAANEKYCLTFYFAQRNEDPGAKLTVYLKDLNTNEQTSVWVLDKGDDDKMKNLNSFDWVFAQVTIPSSPAPVEIVVDGEVQSSGWAIDDIRLYTTDDDCTRRPLYI